MLMFYFCRCWGSFSRGFKAISIIYSLITFLGGGYYVFKALSILSYSVFQKDGIHGFSRTRSELIVIRWEDIKECKWFLGSDNEADYMMLIFDQNALFCGKNLSEYQGYPRPNSKEAKPYRLDELMEKLARREITEEKFKEIPFILVVAKKHEYEQYYAMWRARKKTEANSPS